VKVKLGKSVTGQWGKICVDVGPYLLFVTNDTVPITPWRGEGTVAYLRFSASEGSEWGRSNKVPPPRKSLRGSDANSPFWSNIPAWFCRAASYPAIRQFPFKSNANNQVLRFFCNLQSYNYRKFTAKVLLFSHSENYIKLTFVVVNLWPPYVIGQAIYIFILWFLLLYFFLFFLA